MSRPPDLEARSAEQAAFLAAFARTGIARTAAAEAGVFPVKHYRWLKDDAAYARRFAELEQQTRDLAKASRAPHSRGYRVQGARIEKRRRKQEAILAALMKTGIVEDAAREAGTTVTSFHAWCRDDPEFAARAEAIRAEAEPRRQRIMLQRVSAANKAAWTPERRDAWAEYQRGTWTPEKRGAAARRIRARMDDPDFKADWLAKSRASREFAACDNPSYFDVIDTTEKAYWLGFIATDGFVTGFRSGSLRLGVKLARKDREHLVTLHHVLRAKRPIRDFDERVRLPQGGEPRVYSVSKLDVCSPQIVNSLVAHGILPRKSLILEPWDGPADLMPHYWRGIFDGDGSITINADGIQLALAGTKPVVEAFIAWAHGICGTKCTAHKPGNGGRHWITSVAGTRMPRALLAALYDDAPVALPRKKALADLAVHGKPLQATIF